MYLIPGINVHTNLHLSTVLLYTSVLGILLTLLDQTGRWQVEFQGAL